jgi:hypothetical protein
MFSLSLMRCSFLILLLFSRANLIQQFCHIYKHISFVLLQIRLCVFINGVKNLIS